MPIAVSPTGEEWYLTWACGIGSVPLASQHYCAIINVRICSGPGCLRAVSDDARYCVECNPAPVAVDNTKQHSTAYDAELDRLRKGTRWQRLRDRVVRECPLCARCDCHITEIVDHIVPAREAVSQAQLSNRWVYDKYAGYYLRSNLQGLCRPCHYDKTIEDKTHVGPWPDVVTIELQAPKRHFAF